jgi:hypothetical protein
MLKDTLAQIYERDLMKVIQEISSYQNEQDLWIIADGITNSGGNLALHLIGNINHFFGAALGNTGYERKRDAEFADRNVSRAEIIDGLEKAINVMKDALAGLSEEDLQAEFPGGFRDTPQKTETVVIYMLSHLNYHLGQINYHRRLLAS